MCMCIYVQIDTYVCMYMCVHLCKIYVYTHIHCASMYKRICIHTHVLKHVSVIVHADVCIYECMLICLHIHIALVENLLKPLSLLSLFS